MKNIINATICTLFMLGMSTAHARLDPEDQECILKTQQVASVWTDVYKYKKICSYAGAYQYWSGSNLLQATGVGELSSSWADDASSYSCPSSINVSYFHINITDPFAQPFYTNGHAPFHSSTTNKKFDHRDVTEWITVDVWRLEFDNTPCGV